ncbi:MAG: hypothetical protein NZL92_03015 [Gloeomargarita sp. SKYG116]|nr:hypothetical protein [Gloeomargarita sp. SKYG116]MCS7226837.1 hypothetical protein [Gloeomargarita sp. SKYB31]MDW8400651.1 hypothetical protein [Gloeomargarita sp. SKYGB_i_bin116]
MRHTLPSLGLILTLWTTPVFAQLGTQLPPPADWQQRQQRRTIPPQHRPLPVPGMAPIGQGSPLPPAPGVLVNPEQSYRVLVVGMHPVRLHVLRQLAPQAFPVQHQGQIAMQTGVFQSLQEAEQFAAQLRQNGLPAQVVGPVNPQRDAQVQMVLNPPTQGSDWERIAAWQSLRQNTMPSHRPTIRVFVRPAAPTQQEDILKLVPEAFRSMYRGQVLWQVGRFHDQNRAEQLVQYLRARGFQVVVESQ